MTIGEAQYNPAQAKARVLDPRFRAPPETPPPPILDDDSTTSEANNEDSIWEADTQSAIPIPLPLFLC